MRAIAALLCLLLPAPAALAGNTAEAHVLGFTDDRRLFAFEEYGVQDGSGFPYSNIYVVDVDRDSWVSGTPVRVMLRDEGATVAEARAGSEAGLQAAVAEDFRAEQAVTLAHSPLAEVESDPVRLSFAPIIPSNPLDDPEARYEARLEIYYAEAQAENCVTYIGDRPMGLRLTVAREGGGEVVLREDRTIPRSRGCPITYRLSRIVGTGSPPDRIAVLISIFTPGFEGPDRRFIAVTGRLPE